MRCDGSNIDCVARLQWNHQTKTKSRHIFSFKMATHTNTHPKTMTFRFGSKPGALSNIDMTIEWPFDTRSMAFDMNWNCSRFFFFPTSQFFLSFDSTFLMRIKCQNQREHSHFNLIGALDLGWIEAILSEIIYDSNQKNVISVEPWHILMSSLINEYSIWKCTLQRPMVHPNDISKSLTITCQTLTTKRTDVINPEGSFSRMEASSGYGWELM